MWHFPNSFLPGCKYQICCMCEQHRRVARVCRTLMMQHPTDGWPSSHRWCPETSNSCESNQSMESWQFPECQALWCQYISNTVQCSACVMHGMVSFTKIRNIYVSISVKWIRTISDCNQDLVCHIQVSCLSSSGLWDIKNGEKWECYAKCRL